MPPQIASSSAIPDQCRGLDAGFKAARTGLGIASPHEKQRHRSRAVGPNRPAPSRPPPTGHGLRIHASGDSRRRPRLISRKWLRTYDDTQRRPYGRSRSRSRFLLFRYQGGSLRSIHEPAGESQRGDRENRLRRHSHRRPETGAPGDDRLGRLRGRSDLSCPPALDRHRRLGTGGRAGLRHRADLRAHHPGARAGRRLGPARS